MEKGTYSHVYIGAEALRNAYFGAGKLSQDIQLDGMECTGTESRLLDCPHGGLNIYNCGHQEDAGVRCTRPPGKSPHLLHMKIVAPGR